MSAAARHGRARGRGGWRLGGRRTAPPPPHASQWAVCSPLMMRIGPVQARRTRDGGGAGDDLAGLGAGAASGQAAGEGGAQGDGQHRVGQLGAAGVVQRHPDVRRLQHAQHVLVRLHIQSGHPAAARRGGAVWKRVGAAARGSQVEQTRADAAGGAAVRAARHWRSEARPPGQGQGTLHSRCMCQRAVRCSIHVAVGGASSCRPVLLRHRLPPAAQRSVASNGASPSPHSRILRERQQEVGDSRQR